MAPRLYDHDDFIGFLRAHAAYRRRRNPGWSYSAWARKLKLSGAAAITMVINGQRGPGPKLQKRLMDYFGFEAEEREYFTDLVQAHRFADEPPVAGFFRDRISRRRRAVEAGHAYVALPTFDAIAHWRYYALRELTALEDFREDDAWIGSRLRFDPGEPPSQVLAKLQALGLLARDAQGRLRPSPHTIHTRRTSSTRPSASFTPKPCG